MKKILFWIILGLMVIRPADARGLEVRISGGRLTLHAEDVQLKEVLRRFAAQGVAVQIDPELNPRISADIENQPAETALKSILKSFNHALVWESVPGPEKFRLAEIQIFEPGKKEAMRPFRPTENFKVVKNPADGSFFVQNELLLRLRPGASASEFDKFIKALDGVVLEKNERLGVYKIRLPQGADVPALVERIAKGPGPVFAEANQVYPVILPYQGVGESPPIQDHSSAFQSRGSAAVAILDSGLLPGSAAEAQVVASLDAVNSGDVFSDGLGHGTQMALIASGVINPLGISTASDASTPIIPIRAFDDNGMTTSFAVMDSIDFALKNGAKVMSLSWGTETRSPFLEEAMDYAASKGLFVIAAAGNEPTGKPVYPAAFPSVLGVGALGPDGKPWKQSNYGDFVEISAPGFASLPVGYQGNPGTYAGTSIATAYVAGTLARYLSENPEAGRQEAIHYLKRVFK
jgi:hypothetical protein